MTNSRSRWDLSCGISFFPFLEVAANEIRFLGIPVYCAFSPFTVWEILYPGHFFQLVSHPRIAVNAAVPPSPKDIFSIYFTLLKGIVECIENDWEKTHWCKASCDAYLMLYIDTKPVSRVPIEYSMLLPCLELVCLVEKRQSQLFDSVSTL